MSLLKTPKFLIPASIAIVAALGITTAVAQNAIPAPNAVAADSAQVDFRRAAQLSPQEQLMEADRSLGKLEGASANVRKSLEQARKARDVVKTLCLDDKLSQLDVATRSARERRSSLQAAVNSKNTELSGHEFTVLQVLRQRGDQLVVEAAQCVGEETTYAGESAVTLTIDPEVSRADEGVARPIDNPINIGIVGQPPQCISCTR